MRTMMIAGNWKMNLLRADAVGFAAYCRREATSVPEGRELLLAPPYTLLAPLAAELEGTPLALAGQDLHPEASGAFTGAISGAMLRDAGCRYVLVGHSERRTLFGDDGARLHAKLRAALAQRLIPIYCVGEQLAEREGGETASRLEAQCEEVLAGLEPEAARGIVLAYEPVWAIGTGRTATPAIAEEAHRGLRDWLGRAFGRETAEWVRILYGGSVKPENAAELLGQANIDGALIGGASLQPESFLAIARAGAA